MERVYHSAESHDAADAIVPQLSDAIHRSSLLLYCICCCRLMAWCWFDCWLQKILLPNMIDADVTGSALADISVRGIAVVAFLVGLVAEAAFAGVDMHF